MRYQLPLSLLLAASATACVGNTPAGTEETPDEIESALELDNGGLETTDEVAMFDQELAFTAAKIETDTDVADPMVDDPEVATMLSAPTGERIRILIAWGRMPADPNATDGRDWSGSLRVSRGAVLVNRRLGFEEATDRVLPRTTRDRIDFESRTRPFADGLALRVLDPDRANAEPVRLTYEGRDGTVRDIDLRDLVAGPRRIDLGDGNRIVAAALRERDACDHGFLRGRWHALRENVGVYRGLVTNEAGEVTGHVRGIYGQRRNGEKVMFGKYINRDGQFRGILAGTYADGEFHARWITRTGDHGIMGGHYVDSPDVRGGGFMGRWAETSCAE